ERRSFGVRRLDAAFPGGRGTEDGRSRRVCGGVFSPRARSQSGVKPGHPQSTAGDSRGHFVGQSEAKTFWG
ncbi:MAG: hypothetical protein AAF471_07255, partial [Myxococcota bacterium]